MCVFSRSPGNGVFTVENISESSRLWSSRKCCNDTPRITCLGRQALARDDTNTAVHQREAEDRGPGLLDRPWSPTGHGRTPLHGASNPTYLVWVRPPPCSVTSRRTAVPAAQTRPFLEPSCAGPSEWPVKAAMAGTTNRTHPTRGVLYSSTSG